MDTSFGFLCLIPSIVAVTLALITKQTVLSLFVAVWAGSTMINGYNPIIGFIKIFSDYIIPSIASEWNAGLLVLVTMSGGLVAMLRVTGSAQAFAKLVTGKIDSAKTDCYCIICIYIFLYRTMSYLRYYYEACNRHC
jgi:tetracycline resistance efflux pump